MVIKFLTILLIVIGLYTVSGWTCYSDNEYIVKVRKTLNLESGCSYIKP